MAEKQSPAMKDLARVMNAHGYELLDFIAGGGMGEVYRARQVNLDRTVAIKIPKARAYGDEDQRNPTRLLNEARTIARLDHDNIVRIYDCSLWGGQVAIVMEYMEGQTLAGILEAGRPETLDPFYRAMLRAPGRLLPEWTIRIGEQLSGALAYAHAMHVTHRDIKPSNIFIGPRGQVKLFDFSIARDRQSKDITQAGALVGSPLYMSPEQIECARVDGRADIYAVGCVLFRCVAGRPPFESEKPFNICMRHLQEAPADPASLAPGTPLHLSRCILRCLEKKREDRFQTAMELGPALKGPQARVPDATLEVPAPILGEMMKRTTTAVPHERRRRAPPTPGAEVASDVIPIRESVVPIARPAGEKTRAPEPPGAAAPKPPAPQTSVPPGRGAWVAVGMVAFMVMLAVLWYLSHGGH